MHQELEALKEAQNGHNPMDVSLTDNIDVNCECENAEQEKCKLAEALKKPKSSTNKLLQIKTVKSAWK